MGYIAKKESHSVLELFNANKHFSWTKWTQASVTRIRHTDTHTHTDTQTHTYTHTHIHIYIYIYIYNKNCGKMGKLDTYEGFNSYNSFFMVYFFSIVRNSRIKYEISILNPL